MRMLLSWSGGKDAAWALQVLRGRPDADVVGLLTTVTAEYERIAMHGIRRELLHAQARATGLPVIEATIPSQCDNATYETSFDLTSYEYKVYDSDGDVVGSGLVTEPVKAGQEFTVKWSSDAEVFMIYVRGEDQLGRFTEYKLVPWSVEIPHTEINFDSGKWDIKNDEAPKLDEAVAVAFHELEALEKVNAAVNANITPQLYIVGYTDTVGSGPANQKLSHSRAKAIA